MKSKSDGNISCRINFGIIVLKKNGLSPEDTALLKEPTGELMGSPDDFENGTNSDEPSLSVRP